MKSHITIRKARPQDGKAFLSLVNALADFEKLARPTPAARARLLKDGFGRKKRFEAFLARDGKKPVGYAIIFYTYSSFLALPTLYLEDLFVLPGYRGRGVGKQLFLHCVREAERQKCGRMEWVVLDWNTTAIKFYERFGAQHLKEWYTFRLTANELRKILTNS